MEGRFEEKGMVPPDAGPASHKMMQAFSASTLHKQKLKGGPDQSKDCHRHPSFLESDSLPTIEFEDME